MRPTKFSLQLSRENGQLIEYVWDPQDPVDKYVDVRVPRIHDKPVGFLTFTERAEHVTRDVILSTIQKHHDRLAKDVSGSFGHYQSRESLYGHEWNL